jgi:hypothetical protein
MWADVASNVDVTVDNACDPDYYLACSDCVPTELVGLN